MLLDKGSGCVVGLTVLQSFVSHAASVNAQLYTNTSIATSPSFYRATGYGSSSSQAALPNDSPSSILPLQTSSNPSSSISSGRSTPIGDYIAAGLGQTATSDSSSPAGPVGSLSSSSLLSTLHSSAAQVPVASDARIINATSLASTDSLSVASLLPSTADSLLTANFSATATANSPSHSANNSTQPGGSTGVGSVALPSATVISYANGTDNRTSLLNSTQSVCQSSWDDYFSDLAVWMMGENVTLAAQSATTLYTDVERMGYTTYTTYSKWEQSPIPCVYTTITATETGARQTPSTSSYSLSGSVVTYTDWYYAPTTVTETYTSMVSCSWTSSLVLTSDASFVTTAPDRVISTETLVWISTVTAYDPIALTSPSPPACSAPTDARQCESAWESWSSAAGVTVWFGAYGRETLTTLGDSSATATSSAAGDDDDDDQADFNFGYDPDSTTSYDDGGDNRAATITNPPAMPSCVPPPINSSHCDRYRSWYYLSSLQYYDGEDEDGVATVFPSTLSLGRGCTLGCGFCTIFGGSIDLLYWDDQTAMPPNATITAPKGNATGLVLATVGTHTLTSPSVYISADGLSASNWCSQVGGKHTDVIFPVDVNTLSKLTNFDDVDDAYTPFPFNLESWRQQASLGGDDWFWLSVPAEANSVDSAWSACKMISAGVLDPPSILTQAPTVDAGATLPGATSTTSSSTPQPASSLVPSTPPPTSTPSTAPQTSSSSATVKANTGPGAGSQGEDPTSSVDPASSTKPGEVSQKPFSTGNAQISDPTSSTKVPSSKTQGDATNANAGTSQSPDSGSGDSAVSNVVNILTSALASSSSPEAQPTSSGGQADPPTAAAGTTVAPNVSNAANGASDPASSSQGVAPPSSAQAASSSGQNASPSQGASKTAPSATGPGVESSQTLGAVVGTGTGAVTIIGTTQVAAAPSSANGQTSLGNAKSSSVTAVLVAQGGSTATLIPGSATTLNGQTVSAAAGGSVVVNDPSSSPQTAGAVVGSGTGAVTIISTAVSGSGSGVVVAQAGSTATLTPGAATIINGQVVSAAADGSIVMNDLGSSPQTLGAVVGSGTGAVTILSTKSSGSGTSVVVVQGGSTATLTLGEATTLNGQLISVATGGSVVVNDPGSPSTATLALNGQNHTVIEQVSQGQTQVLVNGQTLTPGQQVTQSNGQVISLDSAGVLAAAGVTATLVAAPSAPSAGSAGAEITAVATLNGKTYTFTEQVLGSTTQALVNGQTLTQGQQGVVLSGQTVSLDGQGTIVVGSSTLPWSAAQGTGAGIVTATDTSDPLITAIATINGKAHTFTEKVVDGTTLALVDGQTLTQSESGLTIGGQTVSIGRDGSLLVGSTTLSWSTAPSTGNAAITGASNPLITAVATLDGQAYTFTEVIVDGTTEAFINGQTITQNQNGYVVGSQTISVNGDGSLVVGSTTLQWSTALPSASPSILTAAVGSQELLLSETIIDGQTDIIVNGVTLSAGGPGTVIAGQTFTVDPNGVSEAGPSGTSFISFRSPSGAADPTSQGTGDGTVNSGGSGFHAPATASLAILMALCGLLV